MKKIVCTASLFLVMSVTYAQAETGLSVNKDGMQHVHSMAHAHAPIGVMGDHMHKEGEWMVSYRFMHMGMEGNRAGTTELDPLDIATNFPNRFSGVAGQPPTLLVVPTEMTMDMHMFGAMYAPTDDITLMVMGNYLEKEMDHITYNSGLAVLGTFTTRSSGIGDTRVNGMFRLYDDETHHLHLNAGLSLPTGSIDETAQVLAPSGATPVLRMPYAMQLGTGTFDLLPGLTYTGQNDLWSWGAQYTAEIRLESENDEGYAWGDKHMLTAWGSYAWQDWISTSARVSGMTQADIRGIDPSIVAPVQTADPRNFGGTTLDFSLGVNLLGQEGMLAGHRLGIEATAPVYRYLNGPQMETDYTVVIGWQKTF